LTITVSMPGIPLSPSKRATIAAQALYEPYSQVAARHNCSKSTVSRQVTLRKETGSNRTAKRSGRPPFHDERTRLRIRRHLEQYPHRYIDELVHDFNSQGIPTKATTLQRLIKSMGLKRCYARIKPFLNDFPCAKRLAYANNHAQDTVSDWRTTIFVDESTFKLNDIYKTKVTRRKGEVYEKKNLKPKFLSAKGSVMVWGVFWHGGHSQLVHFDTNKSEGKRGGVTAAIYRDQVTKEELNYVWRKVNGHWRGYGGARILEDNASVHTANTNRSVGLDQHLVYVDHPPNSPDLNPIENLWSILKRTIAKLDHKPTNTEQLFIELETAWWNIPQGYIDKMVDSMEKRLETVRKKAGLSTKW
jgi:transposase